MNRPEVIALARRTFAQLITVGAILAEMERADGHAEARAWATEDGGFSDREYEICKRVYGLREQIEARAECDPRLLLEIIRDYHGPS